VAWLRFSYVLRFLRGTPKPAVRAPIPTPLLPAGVVNVLAEVPMEGRDTKNDIYEEYLRSACLLTQVMIGGACD
jgi:hypothetical protein